MERDLARQLARLHLRVQAMVVGPQVGQARSLGIEARLPSYAGLDDNREDRAEYREATELTHLHDRLDTLQYEQYLERRQGYGMEL